MLLVSAEHLAFSRAPRAHFTCIDATAARAGTVAAADIIFRARVRPSHRHHIPVDGHFITMFRSMFI